MESLQALNRFLGILTQTRRSLKESKRSKESLDTLKMRWAQNILGRLSVDLELVGTPCAQRSMLFLGNHISYLDIPLLMGTIDRISFVAKKELQRWPLFGAGAKQLDTVFVKRNNKVSRNSAKNSIQDAIHKGKRVVVFPSGTTSIDGEKSWKKGAFDIAMTTDCIVQPFRISYQPLREVAYIDKDFFPHHLIKLNRQQSIKAKVEFHDPINIKDPIRDCRYWKEWANAPVLNQSQI